MPRPPPPDYGRDRAQRLARTPYDREHLADHGRSNQNANSIHAYEEQEISKDEAYEYEAYDDEAYNDEAYENEAYEDEGDGSEDAFEGDSDSEHEGDAYNLEALGPALDEQGEPAPENIFNPRGARNNCVNLALGYVSGLPLGDIEDRFGPPTDEPLPADEMYRRANALGIDISETPPRSHFMEGAREAAVAIENPNGVGHCVAVVQGSNEANYLYSDHQILADEDVTDQVRAGRFKKLYMKRRQPDDPAEKSESSEEEDDWVR